MNCAFTHTLSKREIFMAFIVSASTNIGGPSSNTSLMNSLPQFKTRTRGLRKRNHQHHKIQILSSQFVLHRLQCEICSLVKCCIFHQHWLPARSQTTVQPATCTAFPSPRHYIILNQVVSRQAYRSSLCLSAVSDSCHHSTQPLRLKCIRQLKNEKIPVGGSSSQSPQTL